MTKGRPEGVDPDTLASYCGKIVPRIAGAGVLKSIQAGIPPHLDPRLKISPQAAAGLSLAVSRALDLKQGKTTDPYSPMARQMSLAVDFGVPASPRDLGFLRSVFGRVVCLSEIEGAEDSPQSALEAAADEKVDFLLTHRGAAGGRRKKNSQKTITQCAEERHAPMFNAAGSALSRSRQVFETPFLLHYNPHIETRTEVVALRDLERPEGMNVYEWCQNLEQAIRQAGGKKEMMVHGLHVDIEQTLALCQIRPVSIADMNELPEGVTPLRFMAELARALRAESDAPFVNLYGFEIDREKTLSARQRRAYSVDQLSLPKGQTLREFISALDEGLKRAEPNSLVQVAGLDVLVDETRADPKGRVWLSEPDGRVFLRSNQESFTFDQTGGQVCLIERTSSLEETMRRHFNLIVHHGVVRSHTGMTLNGEGNPATELCRAGPSETDMKVYKVLEKLGPSLERAVGVKRLERDPYIYSGMLAVATAAAIDGVSFS